jgi:nucleoside 2-deoxyribosyltransferase
MTSIFISHSARDRSIAAAIEHELEKLGFDVFNPANDIRAGDRWSDAIKSGIRRADMVIVLVASPEAAGTSWIGYELGVAEALGKPVLVLASNTNPLSTLPVDLLASRVLSFDPRMLEAAARVVAEQVAA